ncbi:interleukin-20-like [Dendropsophus ebraccatus]|uniref:interleukin-20-like n=1 Tax=Dendropsophus ebraccatus TaxID=150705 RepID=UPI0038312423
MERRIVNVCRIVATILMMTMSCTDAIPINGKVSADLLELKRHFDAIKEILQREDTITDISLMKESILNHIHESEQCCFLNELGSFYLANVFPNIDFTKRKIHERKQYHNLANALLGLKTELTSRCHDTMGCQCGAQAMNIMEEFKDKFSKLEKAAAAHKAVGELHILYRWVEKNFFC